MICEALTKKQVSDQCSWVVPGLSFLAFTHEVYLLLNDGIFITDKMSPVFIYDSPVRTLCDVSQLKAVNSLLG